MIILMSHDNLNPDLNVKFAVKNSQLQTVGKIFRKNKLCLNILYSVIKLFTYFIKTFYVSFPLFFDCYISTSFHSLHFTHSYFI